MTLEKLIKDGKPIETNYNDDFIISTIYECQGVRYLVELDTETMISQIKEI